MQPPQKQPEFQGPPGSDAEGGAANGVKAESHFRGLSDVQKWKKDDWMKKGVLALILRSCALLFSFIAFILFATHIGFDKIESESYGFAIALIAMVYSAVQVGIKGHELRTGNDVIKLEISVWIDFIGDQFMSYMLLSSASAGAAVINPIRVAAERAAAIMQVQLDQSAFGHPSAAIAMSFLAFFSLASASIISGYHLFAELSKS